MVSYLRVSLVLNSYSFWTQCVTAILLPLDDLEQIL